MGRHEPHALKLGLYFAEIVGHR